MKTKIGSLVAAGSLVGGSLLLASGPAASAAPTTQTFSYTGATQSYTVPSGVCSISVVTTGASGGASGTLNGEDSPTPGGPRRQDHGHRDRHPR